MKKTKFLIITIILAILALSPISAFADDSSRQYRFNLSSGGGSEIEAATGDTITVVFSLERIDSAGSSNMYAMQNEIKYDKSFFRLVEGSYRPADGITVKSLGTSDGLGTIYMNYLSVSGGTEWAADSRIGSFQLEVLASSGSSEIVSSNYLVSTRNGADKYLASADNLKVIVSFGSGGDDTGGDTDSSGGTTGGSTSGGSAAAAIRAIQAAQDEADDSDPDAVIQSDGVPGSSYTEGDNEDEVEITESESPGAAGSSEAASNMFWLLILLIIVLAIILFLLLWKRRKKKEEEEAA